MPEELSLRNYCFLFNEAPKLTRLYPSFAGDSHLLNCPHLMERPIPNSPSPNPATEASALRSPWFPHGIPQRNLNLTMNVFLLPLIQWCPLASRDTSLQGIESINPILSDHRCVPGPFALAAASGNGLSPSTFTLPTVQTATSTPRSSFSPFQLRLLSPSNTGHLLPPSPDSLDATGCLKGYLAKPLPLPPIS